MYTSTRSVVILNKEYIKIKEQRTFTVAKSLIVTFVSEGRQENVVKGPGLGWGAGDGGAREDNRGREGEDPGPE